MSSSMAATFAGSSLQRVHLPWSMPELGDHLHHISRWPERVHRRAIAGRSCLSQLLCGLPHGCFSSEAEASRTPSLLGMKLAGDGL